MSYSAIPVNNEPKNFFRICLNPAKKSPQLSAFSHELSFKRIFISEVRFYPAADDSPPEPMHALVPVDAALPIP
jgi:hypothetical protein